MTGTGTGAEPDAGTTRARHPRRRIVRRIGLIALAAGLVALVGFVVWAESPMRAEDGPLAAVRADPALTVRESSDSVALLPRHPDGSGLLFLSGARVDAAAYAATFQGTADAGVTVVIVRPILNFAIFEFRSPRPSKGSPRAWTAGSWAGTRSAG